MNQEDTTNLIIAALFGLFVVSSPYNILLGGRLPLNMIEYAIAMTCVVAAIILLVILAVSIWT
jgi:hypothetical protein